MSTEPSSVYDQLLAGSPPVTFPEAWRFVEPHPDARMLEADPRCLISRLRKEFSKGDLLRSRVLLRRGDRRLVLSPRLMTPDRHVIMVRDSFERPSSLLTSSGELHGGPPLFALERDARVHYALSASDKCLYAAGSMADFVLLRSLGLAASPATGLERLSRRGLEHLLSLVGGYAEPPISPRRLRTSKHEINLSGYVGNRESAEFCVVLLGYDLVSGRAIIPVEILAAARYLAAAEKSLGISWDGLYVWWPTDEELQNLDFRRQLADATLVRDFFRDPRSLYPVSEFANPDVLPDREKAFVAVFDDLVEAIAEIRTEWSQRSQERVRQKRSEYSRWINDRLFEPLIETAIDCEDLRIGALRMQQAHVTRILHRMMPDIYAVLNESAAASNREFLPDSTYKQIQSLVDEMIRLVKAETHVKKQGGRGSGWWPRGRG